MPRVAAISSCPRPANWRSSTTLAATASSRASRVRASSRARRSSSGSGAGVSARSIRRSRRPASAGTSGGRPRPGCAAWPRPPRRRSGPGRPTPVRIAADQPQVRLVHQGRGLERLTGRLAREPMRRQPAQLVVHQRQQLARRPRLAPTQGLQDARDFAFAAFDATLLIVS